MSGRRVDHQIRRLVDDQQIPVLKNDLQWNILGRHGGFHRIRPLDLNDVAGPRSLRWLGWAAVEQHTSLSQEALDLTPGTVGIPFVQETIQPYPGMGGLHGKYIEFGHGSGRAGRRLGA